MKKLKMEVAEAEKQEQEWKRKEEELKKKERVSKTCHHFDVFIQSDLKYNYHNTRRNNCRMVHISGSTRV